MSAQRLLLPVVAMTGGSVLVGCSNCGSCGCGSGSYGSYGSYGACAYGLSPAAGIYEGTLTDATGKNATPVVALVPESGPALVSTQNGAFYSLNVSVAGGSGSGSYSALDTASGLPNGGRSDSGNASLVLGASSLNGALTDQVGNTQSLKLTFDARYNAPPPSGALVGTWFNPTANGLTLTLSIDANGALTGNDSNSCTYSGNLTNIDPEVDMFNATFTRTCGSETVTFAGLVSYFSAAGSTPAQLQVMADDPNGDYLGLVLQPG